MRTTIDIPTGLHQQIKAHAEIQEQSFSASATEMMLRGIATVDMPSTLHRSPITGLLVFNSGQQITSEEVAALIDEDD